MKVKSHKSIFQNLLLLIPFWLFISAIMLFQQYIFTLNYNNPFDLLNSISYRVPNYIYWALLTPLIFNFAKKLRVEFPVAVKTLFYHLLIGLLLAVIHRTVSIVSGMFLRAIFSGNEFSIVETVVGMQVPIFGGSIDSLLMYFVILAAIYAYEYYKKFREQEIKSVKLETQLVNAELQSLKMQLHPHFLFNTLNSIASLMRKDVDKAELMLTNLSDLLRISLDNIGQNETTLEQELDFINRYLDIQKIRYKDRLEIEINIDPHTLDKKVPNLILQPIVENSIKHGIEPITEKGKICISSFLENGNLILSVSDNGPGLKGNSINGMGIGLSNVKSRLEQMYSFDCFSIIEKEKGFEVKLTLPLN